MYKINKFCALLINDLLRLTRHLDIVESVDSLTKQSEISVDRKSGLNNLLSSSAFFVVNKNVVTCCLTTPACLLLLKDIL